MTLLPISVHLSGFENSWRLIKTSPESSKSWKRNTTPISKSFLMLFASSWNRRPFQNLLSFLPSPKCAGSPRKLAGWSHIATTAVAILWRCKRLRVFLPQHAVFRPDLGRLVVLPADGGVVSH